MIKKTYKILKETFNLSAPLASNAIPVLYAFATGVLSFFVFKIAQEKSLLENPDAWRLSYTVALLSFAVFIAFWAYLFLLGGRKNLEDNT